MNSKNKYLFLAFLIATGSMVSNSSAYTSACVNSKATTAITDDEHALVALSTASAPGNLTICFTNNLFVPIKNISIVDNLTGDVVGETDRLSPGSQANIDITASGSYLVEANWAGGCATMDKVFDVEPLPIPAPAPAPSDDPSGIREVEKTAKPTLDEAVQELSATEDKNSGTQSERTQEPNSIKTMTVENVKINIIHK